jgi:hypothetical protein
MISPIMSWTMALALGIGGIALLLPSATVLAVWVLRNWCGRIPEARHAGPDGDRNGTERNVIPP